MIHQRYKNLSPAPSFPHAKQLGHEMDQLLKQGRADVMAENSSPTLTLIQYDTVSYATQMENQWLSMKTTLFP